jgi:hypothetical protein
VPCQITFDTRQWKTLRRVDLWPQSCSQNVWSHIAHCTPRWFTKMVYQDGLPRWFTKMVYQDAVPSGSPRGLPVADSRRFAAAQSVSRTETPCKYLIIQYVIINRSSPIVAGGFAPPNVNPARCGRRTIISAVFPYPASRRLTTPPTRGFGPRAFIADGTKKMRSSWAAFCPIQKSRAANH